MTGFLLGASVTGVCMAYVLHGLRKKINGLQQEKLHMTKVHFKRMEDLTIQWERILERMDGLVGGLKRDKERSDESLAKVTEELNAIKAKIPN